MASHYTCIMNYAFYNDDLQDAKHMVTYIIPMRCWGAWVSRHMGDHSTCFCNGGFLSQGVIIPVM